MFTRKWADIIASRIDMNVSKNRDTVDMILEGLTKSGGGCPCVVPAFRTKDHNCPCTDARENKECRCGLFE